MGVRKRFLLEPFNQSFEGIEMPPILELRCSVHLTKPRSHRPQSQSLFSNGVGQMPVGFFACVSQFGHVAQNGNRPRVTALRKVVDRVRHA